MCTQTSYRAGCKGSYKNIYGGFIAKIAMYLPFAIGLLLSFQFASLISKLLLEKNIINISAANNLPPILILCLIVMTSIIWIKIYVPYVSRVIAEKTGLPWKNYVQTLEVDENGITVSIPEMKTSMSWHAIDRVIDRHGFVYFYYGQFANMIPWEIFTSDIHRQEFVEYCQSKIEQ